MKHLLLWGFILLVASNLTTGISQESKEQEEIKKAIMDYYHEGHVKSDPTLYNQILHDEWKFFYLDDEGKLITIDKETYKSWYKQGKVNPALKWETMFYYIDVSKHNAAVKIRIKNQEFGYIDHFNMMKISGKWWIVNKISHKL
ncbi:MAG: nuclear transport factor 2 family protein [Candidatus Aminicenantes bacterium]|nr:nuclear transport factor 2 family protein [Candidatus Aminicenantes bacterium]MDH5385611.1 nuclear transport factor 2 family protein [Candidatus Aminicenantes bacterium]MDH5743948.1 nuclear transport factor 2 family protein [Candidatus Aminicenantes bacterium]